MFLEFGVLRQGGKAVELGLVGFGSERFVVDEDEAGYVAFGGFDDGFGGVAVFVDAAEEVLVQWVILGGVEAMLDGLADEGGGVGLG